MIYFKDNAWLTVVFILCIFGCTSKENPGKPNILIINIDDMGWRDVGFMGSEFYETPNLDKLAGDGMIFTNAYAAAANCAPSRACLMTGKWTPRHGVYTVGSSERGESRHRKLIPVENITTLPKELDVIPQVLRENGYTTCHAGKWHLSEDPTKYGFDMNIGGGHNGHPQSYYPPYGNVELEADGEYYLTDVIMKKAIEFVDSVQQPFFLNYSPYAVHTPIHPVDSLLDKYKNKPAWNGQDNAAYATMVDNLDRNIGLLIESLEVRGFLENTLIVFTSDNGGLYGITKQLPLRAGKGSYYEGGIREPFFIYWKNRIETGESNVPVTNLDIFPTLMDVINKQVEETDFDGKSLLPLLEGEVDDIYRPLYWHFPIYLQAYNRSDNQNRDSLFRTRPGSVIRYGEWKLHQYFEDDGLELYNLEEDISETANLVDAHPAKAEELLKMLQTWRENNNAPVPLELNPEYGLQEK